MPEPYRQFSATQTERKPRKTEIHNNHALRLVSLCFRSARVVEEEEFFPLNRRIKSAVWEGFWLREKMVPGVLMDEEKKNTSNIFQHLWDK